MSDNQNGSAQDQYEIELRWKTSAFLPERQNDLAKKDIWTISERLSPSMFETLESTKQYWSVPERLLDIRILMLFRDSLIREQPHNKEDNEKHTKIDDLISDLRRIQFDLYIIVFRFAEWCFTFAEADRQLRSGNNRISDNRQKSIGQLRSAFAACFGSDASSEMHVDNNYKQENLDEYLSMLKKLANYTCTKINENFERFNLEYVTNPKKLLDELKKIKNSLRIDDATQKNMQTYFGDDPSRCVALLMLLPDEQSGNQDRRSESQYLAFSGFLDCEDTKLLNELKFELKPKLADEFKRISEGYGAELVTLSSNIVAYKVNEDFSLRKSLTLLEAVNEAKKNAKAQNVIEDKEISKRYYGPIKKDYSCCERKILAAEDLSEKQGKKAMLLVTFQPCLRCYGALKAWKRKKGIKQLSVKYIPPKYLVVEKNSSASLASASSETPINPSPNMA